MMTSVFNIFDSIFIFIFIFTFDWAISNFFPFLCFVLFGLTKKFFFYYDIHTHVHTHTHKHTVTQTNIVWLSWIRQKNKLEDNWLLDELNENKKTKKFLFRNNFFFFAESKWPTVDGDGGHSISNRVNFFFFDFE